MHFAGRRVAYAVTGAGPPLVAPAWWVSHLELDWENQAFRGLWESIGAGYTAVAMTGSVSVCLIAICATRT